MVIVAVAHQSGPFLKGNLLEGASIPAADRSGQQAISILPLFKLSLRSETVAFRAATV